MSIKIMANMAILIVAKTLKTISEKKPVLHIIYIYYYVAMNCSKYINSFMIH